MRNNKPRDRERKEEKCRNLIIVKYPLTKLLRVRRDVCHSHLTRADCFHHHYTAAAAAAPHDMLSPCRFRIKFFYQLILLAFSLDLAIKRGMKGYKNVKTGGHAAARERESICF
jgi:hypothetical protein